MIVLAINDKFPLVMNQTAVVSCIMQQCCTNKLKKL